MDWKRVTKKTMPPEEERVLLWRDYGHNGFPVIGINHEGCLFTVSHGVLCQIQHCEWRTTRWALINPPEGA